MFFYYLSFIFFVFKCNSLVFCFMGLEFLFFLLMAWFIFFLESFIFIYFFFFGIMSSVCGLVIFFFNVFSYGKEKVMFYFYNIKFDFGFGCDKMVLLIFSLLVCDIFFPLVVFELFY